MTKDTLRAIPNAGFFTAFVFDDRIDILVRSADWYNLPPIQRFLYNMAASNIRMEDAKTETRVYTFERYEHLRQLIIRSRENEWTVAWEAWLLWWHPDMSFGVVHLDQSLDCAGDLLLGDSPLHLGEFAPDVATGVATIEAEIARRRAVRSES